MSTTVLKYAIIVLIMNIYHMSFHELIYMLNITSCFLYLYIMLQHIFTEES